MKGSTDGSPPFFRIVYRRDGRDSFHPAPHPRPPVESEKKEIPEMCFSLSLSSVLICHGNRIITKEDPKASAQLYGNAGRRTGGPFVRPCIGLDDGERRGTQIRSRVRCLSSIVKRHANFDKESRQTSQSRGNFCLDFYVR